MVGSWCVIEAKCVPSGAAKPGEPCLSCQPVASGAAWTPVAVGAGCDDGDSCTKDDACNAVGACKGAPLACSIPPNADCFESAGACQNGVCTFTAKAGGTSCNDNDPCTSNDGCDGKGQCVGTPGGCKDVTGGPDSIDSGTTPAQDTGSDVEAPVSQNETSRPAGCTSAGRNAGNWASHAFGALLAMWTIGRGRARQRRGRPGFAPR